jgi:CDP-4-dehydro-6-deoxyglucose reductase
MSAVVRLLPSGHEFVVEANEPLLEAALRSGLALEFGCSNGSCGECKGRVKEGAVRRIRFHDYIIRDAERREGTVLLCCCTADSDATIEAGEAGGPDDIPVQKIRARLYKQEVIAGEVAIVHLRVMRGKMLRFLAGQHTSLKPVGGRAADVSIASCPCDGLHQEFHFDARGVDEVTSRVFAGLTPSDRFEIHGPRGRFTLDEDSDRPLVFVASDTAIAPIKSIIEHAINLDYRQPIHLCWHTTRAHGNYLHNYFRSLTDALDAFRYVPTAGLMSAGTLRGLPDLASADVYLAGGEAFVAIASESLRARGLPPERLFIDALNRRPRPPPTAD